MSEPDFGVELRGLRRSAGISLAELARRVPYSKGYLSKVETGAAQPNAKLAELCDTELAAGGRLAALVPTSRPRRARPRLGGLPPVTSHFTGRADEQRAVMAVLSRTVKGSSTVCAIDGMPGAGKTALAVYCAHELAARFTDGCLFLDLRAGEALHRALRLLDVPVEDVHPADAATVYRDRLRGKRILVVLDNANSAAEVVPLLPAEPRCAVLVTSRRRLAALDDAHHVSLGELDEPAATRLFHSVAGTGGNEPVARIVRRCGLLPLAVRIAAARYRANPAWTVAGLERRLADEEARLPELDDGERSVSAAFHVSYDALPAEQQRMFALLAVHRGPDVDAHAAAALADTDVRHAERLLGRLHDVHLLLQHDIGRYRFHDLVRAFAADLPTPDRAAAVHRLLDHMLGAAEAADLHLSPHRHRPAFGLPGTHTFADQTTAKDWLATEWPNLVALCRMAHRHAVHTRCWQLAYTLRGYFFVAKLWDPWIETHTLAVDSTRALGDKRAEAITLNNMGVAHIDRGDHDHAATCYEDALALFRAVGDDHGMHNCLVNLAWVIHYRGDHATALRDMWTALAFYRRQGADGNAAITQRGIAVMQLAAGDVEAAIDNAGRSLTVFRRLGMVLDTAMALNCLGEASFAAGSVVAAAEAYHEAVTVSETCGSGYEAARAECGLSRIAAARGDEAAEARHLARAECAGGSLRS
jgi:tetratricopeptide (TPR) repeat protein